MTLCLGCLSVLVALALSVYVLQKLCFPYFWRDLLFLQKVVRYGVKLEVFKLTSSVRTVLDRFLQQVQRIPDKPFVIYDGNVHTYRDIDRRSNRLANVFLEKANLRKGDCVALLMNNEPDFLCVWFGLAKVGCSVAFLNTNIKSKSLLHCFNSCGAKTLIVGSDLVEDLDGILNSLLSDNIQVWAMRSWTKHTEVHSLLDKLESASEKPVPAALHAATSLKTPTLYIFTSGTTGATLVLKKKFSASQFWNDCRKHDVTIFQYIGELCRYLCNQTKTELDKVHKVRMGVGNGLHQDVWQEFQSRFGKIKMCEVYGSTEGNLCFMNHIGKIGSVGRSNFFYRLLFKYDLVKYDIVKDEPVKDQYGFCRRVDKGEMGLLLSKVSAISPFFGYAGSKELTEKKLMRNVFVKGDAYFNTGDLMAEDHEGFIFFRDRVGDTFRWKGENVSTTEVTEILGLVDFIQEVNVYGVQVPGHEGRGGMASIIVRSGFIFDGKKLFEHVVRDLPGYARPLFIRLQEVMETTSTFKQQKFHLVQSGFNPSKVVDPLYVLDYKQKSYIPLTDTIYQSISAGEHKL
uniref:long-chain-fatty-acid--CoA ligase n=1 Tax=Astatotilapia calliptera TaxID=8154 RepID=A0AAX7U1W6_ASTCA